MSHKLRLLELFEGKRNQKIILIVGIMAFFVIELLVYLILASQAGNRARVIITDESGKKVYEAKGSALTSYEKLVFEGTYGPIKNYSIHQETENVPFPVREWILLAVGIPTGLVLMVAFLIRVYLSLLYGGEEKDPERPKAEEARPNRFSWMLDSFHGVSVFHIGALIFAAVLLLWMVPNFLAEFARATMAAIREYKWFFLGVSVFLAGLVTWMIYLKYKLSKQMLDNQLNIEKFRMETQLLMHKESLQHPLLTGSIDGTQDPTTLLQKEG